MLARAWAREQRGRAVLVCAAIALAAALVVFTIAAYRAALARSAGFAADLMGPYEFVVMPKFAMSPTISAELEKSLAGDPGVARVVRTRVVHCDIEDEEDTTYYDSWRAPVIATVDGTIPVPLGEGRAPEPRGGDVVEGVLEGVLSGGLAKRWKVGVGATMPIHGRGGQRELHVVGITDEVLSHRKASGVWVVPAALDELAGGTRTAARLFVDLAEGAPTDEVLDGLKPRFAAADPAAVAHDVRDFARELGTDEAVKNLRNMAGAAAAIVLLAAFFIVATAMGAGADERRRQLALLRTVGTTRGQVVAAVLCESLILGALGCAIGVPLGWLLLQGMGFAQSALFGGWILPDGGGALAAVAAVVATTLCAGLAPAIAAGRVAPIEAMGALARAPRGGGVGLRALVAAGCFLAALGLLVFGTGGGVGAALAATCVGLALLGCSALLAARPAIRAVEALLRRPIARACGVPADLVRHQPGPHLRRAAGMLLTIAVCLGFSITLNVWGRSMVAPFLPSPALPDKVISLLPSGVPPEEADAVAAMPGLDPDRVLPLRVEQTMVGPELLARTGGKMDEIYVQVMGVEPVALDPEGTGMLPLDPTADADLAAMIAELDRDRGCLVPPSFARRFDLAVGDRFALARCGAVGEPVELRIAGLASLPGWHWITKMGRMRTLGGKPTAVIITGPGTAADLGVDRVAHWLADTTDDYELAALRDELQVLADRHAEEYVSPHFGPGGARDPSVKVIATDEIRRRMRERSDSVIWVLGAIPLAGLLVAVLGVANAVAAGIRARRWEFGVLRAVGLEGHQASRLVIAETVVVATAAGLLCAVYGITAAWAAIDVSLQAFNAGTGAPPIEIPWFEILVAWLITTAICCAAAWLSARHLGRSEPLTLLQEGRGGR